MSTRTSRGRISNIRPLTMLPSLKSRRDFAISSCISVITFTNTNNPRLPKVDLIRVAKSDHLHEFRGKQNLAGFSLFRKGESYGGPLTTYFIRRTERARLISRVI